MNDAAHPLASQPLATARALPAEYYCAPHMVALDRRAVFDRSWQLVGHVARISGSGDHLVTEIAGLPVIVLRDEAGQVRAFHNVCRHRAGPLATADGCGARHLRCRYHGWTYGLDGVLRSAPEMQDAEGFEPASIRLPEMRVQVWQGLIFVAGGTAPPFAEFVEGIDQRLGERGFDRYRLVRRVSYELACNWKVYVDNYLEGYHVPHIHPGLNGLLDYRSYVSEVHRWYSLQYSPLESEDTLYGSGEALYWFLWPNTMLNCLPGRMQTNRVQPLGVDRCIVEFAYYYVDAVEDPDEAARRDRDERFSDEVQEEDRTICEQVQRGLASGSYRPGRLNPLRESAVHHFQELLRQAYREHDAG
ncbi:MAG TPA: aromatic ring-hydroxylating dioxygenase subunit alpha [Xanthomonadaceae bacterium]|nr:aromatic ring-hydroxylating dioxygenase subunit alpha [Xanthomonadaceae bacterium]